MQREIESRPLVLLLGAVVVGLTAIAHPLNLAFLAAGLVLFRSLRSWSILAAGLILGLILSPRPVARVIEPIYVQGTVRVVSIPREAADRIYCNANVENLLVRFSGPAAMDIHFGDRWGVSGVVRPLNEIAEQTLGPEGVQGTLSVDEGTRVATGPAAVVWTDGLRRSFAAFAGSALPEEEAAWMDGLCFRAGNLSPQDRHEIDAAGAGYLVAASGLQVYVLAGLMIMALTSLGSPRARTLAVVSLVLAGYCLATGMHLPTVRASLATEIFLGAYLLRREPDSLSALALAAVGFLLVSPQAVNSLGFSMTTIVIAALALFMPRSASAERLGEALAVSVRQCAAAACIVVLAGQPLMALYQGRFTFAAVPANLLAGAVSPIVVGLGFVAFALNPISSALGTGILNIAAPLAAYLRTVTQWVGSAGLGFDVPAFSAWWLVLYYMLWVLAWRPRAKMA